MPCSINPFRAFSTHRIAKRGVAAQECTRARVRGFLENHFEKGLGADEAAPSNCKLEGHASSCPKLQARRAVHQGRSETGRLLGLPKEINGQDARWPHTQDGCAKRSSQSSPLQIQDCTR